MSKDLFKNLEGAVALRQPLIVRKRGENHEKKRQKPVQNNFDDGYYDDRRPADEYLNERGKDISWLPNVVLVVGCVILAVIASALIMHFL